MTEAHAYFLMKITRNVIKKFIFHQSDTLETLEEIFIHSFDNFHIQ